MLHSFACILSLVLAIFPFESWESVHFDSSFKIIDGGSWKSNKNHHIFEMIVYIQILRALFEQNSRGLQC